MFARQWHFALPLPPPPHLLSLPACRLFPLPPAILALPILVPSIALIGVSTRCSPAPFHYLLPFCPLASPSTQPFFCLIQSPSLILASSVSLSLSTPAIAVLAVLLVTIPLLVARHCSSLGKLSMSFPNSQSSHWINFASDELHDTHAELNPLLPIEVSCWGLSLVSQVFDGLSFDLQEAIQLDPTHLQPALSTLVNKSFQLAAL